jgi:hypothetical protein
MRLEAKPEKAQDQDTHEDVEKYPDVDEHRHLVAYGQRKEEDRILNHKEPNQMRNNQLMGHNQQAAR